MTRPNLFALAVLAALALVVFAPLVSHPTQTLYSDHSDLLALHLPSKIFLTRSWRETGSVPLWCPDAFAGMPFVHDVQASAFYPPTLPLYLLPIAWIGAAMSWILVAHVIAAGWCMYAYGRAQGLAPPAAFVAGAGYMLAGKWLLHLLAAGHYNMAPLAWLPLVVLGVERAVAGGRWLNAVGAGGAFAFLILGAYPYVTLYAGVFVALWSLGAALECGGAFDEAPRAPGRVVAALGRWLAAGIIAAATAVGLGSIQLLPALEASGQATRSLGVPPTSALVVSGTRAIFTLVGPALTEESWEQRGNFGLLWVAAAAAAPFLRRGRVRFQAEVTLAVLLYSLGGAVLLQRLPGFNLFRLPTRALLIAAFPVAYLAGVTTQALFVEGATATIRRSVRHLAVLVWIVLLVFVGAHAEGLRGDGKPLRPDPYWLLAGPLLAAAWLVLGAAPSAEVRCVWVLLLAGEAWLLAAPYVAVQAEAGVYSPSACVRDLPSAGRVLDRPPPGGTVGPLWPGLALVERREAVGGFNPLDVRRVKEYLQLVSGEERPLNPLQDVWTYPMLPAFVIQNKPLLDLLGVRYLLQPAGRGAQAPGDPGGAAGGGWRRVADDPAPHAFDFNVGGVRRLPAYDLYENVEVYPRAFVVNETQPLPAGHALAALTHTDLRRVAFLEAGDKPVPTATGSGAARAAAARDEGPDRVVVTVPDGPGGWLVLADPWYPGWSAAVDGGPSLIVYRADYAFRGVPVPAGAHEVVFQFLPASYAVGRWMSAATLAIAAGFGLVALARRGGRGHGRRVPRQGPVAGSQQA